MNGTVGLGCPLVRVKMSVETPPALIAFGEKPFETANVVKPAVRVAFALFPVPLLAVTLLVLLT